MTYVVVGVGCLCVGLVVGFLIGAKVAFDQNQFLVNSYNKHSPTPDPEARAPLSPVCQICGAGLGELCDAGLHG